MKQMAGNEIIRRANIEELAVIRYPDPRLREVCDPVDEVDDSVRRLVERMFELMFAARGVGLAAPQAGIPVRVFVASPTFDPDDRRVYVNPRVMSGEGRQEEEEGCLSFPGIRCRIKRHAKVIVEATNLDGRRFEQAEAGLAARILQHEDDHLDGRLLVDRMGTVARMAHRTALRQLESQFVRG